MPATDYEGTVHQSFIPQTDIERYNLIARFPDVDTAEAAFGRLKECGIDGPNARLLCTDSDTVRTDTGFTERDGRVAHSMSRDAVIGLVAGAVIGAVAGIVVFAILVVSSVLGARVTAGGWIAAALVGAIIGLTLGGLVGGELGFDRSQAGCDTYDDQLCDGVALVGVHTDDEGALRRAAEVLRTCGSLSVRSFAPGEHPTV